MKNKDRDKDILNYILVELRNQIVYSYYKGSYANEVAEKTIADYVIDTNLVSKEFFHDHWAEDKTITNEWLYNTTLKHSDDERLVELLSILFKYFRKNLSQHEILDLNDSHNQNT
jgi:hypothetical protein